MNTEFQGQEKEKDSGPGQGVDIGSPLQTGETKEPEKGFDIVRKKNGQFEKGYTGNVHGSRGRRTAKQNMDRAIEKWAKEHETTLEEATLNLAYKLAEKGNVTLLCKILDKRMANMNEIEVSSRPVTVMPSITRNGKPVTFNVGSETTPFLNAE